MSCRLLALMALVLLSGCITPEGRWGRDLSMPSARELGAAARNAAISPATWMPLAGAALLMIDDQDAELTEWAMEERPLFGDRAQKRGEDLEILLAFGYVATALAAPSERVGDKVRGLGVGATAVLLEGGLTKGLKSAIGRERPNRANNKSMPSGTAGRASVLAWLTTDNLRATPMPKQARRVLNTTVHAASVAAAWSRVEANKHHVSDVLVGNAIGHFLARFVQESFDAAGLRNISVGFQALPGGGSMTLAWRTP